MKLVKILLGLVLGYIAGTVIGATLVATASTNMHDRAQEIATTALIITGPIGALLGAGIGMMLAARSPR